MNLKNKVRRAINNPVVARRKARIVLARMFARQSNDSINFMERDWDVLIILDACRYDLFKKYNPFDSTVEKVHSNASQTREYIENNFVEKDCRDTVYITASPQFANYNLSFARIEHVWQNHWNQELRTVLPESVTNAAINVADRFEDKRLIVHYMQPHYPFIGDIGRTLNNQATFGRGLNKDERLTAGTKELSVWEQLAAGIIDESTVRKAYEENLLRVLPEIQRLIENISGKTVITSDHGNLFGQRVCWLPFRLYGHPAGIHHPELTAVPWIEFPYQRRRQIASATEAVDDDPEVDIAQDRLSDLGYIE